MSISNKSKLTPQVNQLMEGIQKLQTMAIPEFLKIKENQQLNFPDLMNKLMEANARWIKSKGKDLAFRDFYDITTPEERSFLIRLFRFVFNTKSDLDEKENPLPEDVKIEEISANGVPAEWQIVPGANEDRVILYIPGGAMAIGTPRISRYFSVAIGQATKLRVLSVNYRLAPEHPHPAGQEDCVTVYKWLLSTGIKPKNIILSGLSSGGYFALTTLIRLKNEKIDLPLGAVCFSPNTDFREEGYDELFFKNAETDPLLADTGLMLFCLPAYLTSNDPYDPLVSPVLADLKGLPPLLIQASTCEMHYSVIKRFVEKAKEDGVEVTFETWDDVPHGFQEFALNFFPESEDAINHVKNFLQRLFQAE